MSTMHEMFGEPISVYTRAQGIEDGVLVDVPEHTSREAGFRWPVCLTRAAWERCVVEPVDKHGCPVACQDWSGRLWDVLWMGRLAVKASREGGTELRYRLKVVTGPRRSELVTLKLVTGPGDEGEPVITIMLPDED